MPSPSLCTLCSFFHFFFHTTTFTFLIFLSVHLFFFFFFHVNKKINYAFLTIQQLLGEPILAYICILSVTFVNILGHLTDALEPLIKSFASPSSSNALYRITDIFTYL